MTPFAILCSGQGAQTPDLFTSFPFTSKGLRLRDQIVASAALDADVAAWLQNPADEPALLFKNHFAQPLLCLFQAMIWEEIREMLPQPTFIAGYSLGEVSSYACAGACDAGTVVALAMERAKLMDAASPPGELLAVVGLSQAAVLAILANSGGVVAIYIDDEHFVVGCLSEQAEKIAEALRMGGAREVVLLQVSIASHTPLLDSAVQPFRTLLSEIAWHEPQITILGGINGAKVLRREQMLAWLPEQIHHPVRWDLVSARLQEAGCQKLLELGPGTQLSHLALARKCGCDARSVTEFHTPEGIVAWLSHEPR